MTLPFGGKDSTQSQITQDNLNTDTMQSIETHLVLKNDRCTNCNCPGKILSGDSII